jgi:hypothetical protein
VDLRASLLQIPMHCRPGDPELLHQLLNRCALLLLRPQCRLLLGRKFQPSSPCTPLGVRSGYVRFSRKGFIYRNNKGLIDAYRVCLMGVSMHYRNQTSRKGWASQQNNLLSFKVSKGCIDCPETRTCWTPPQSGKITRIPNAPHDEAIASGIRKRLPEEGSMDREHPAGRVMTGSTTRGWSWASRLLEVFSASTGTKGDIARAIKS